MIIEHKTLDFHTCQGRPSYHDITKELKKFTEASGVRNGLLTVQSLHTTCSIYYDEFMHDRNYYGDEYLHADLNDVLERIIPTQRMEGQYHSPGPEHIEYGMAKTDPDYPAEKWSMLNTDAHLRSDLVGSSLNLIIKDGDLVTGSVGSVYFVDFDQTRERNRHCAVLIMGE